MAKQIVEPGQSVTLPAGRKKVIHINRNVIDSNRKHNKSDPPVTVKTSNSNHYGSEIEIEGPSKVIYSPDKPLSCGARMWIETTSEVTVNGK
jgi:hypothetical protein